MKNGQVKHSDKLKQVDIPVEDPVIAQRAAAMGFSFPPHPTLAELQSKPGFYVFFKPRKTGGGDWKGPSTTSHRPRTPMPSGLGSQNILRSKA